MTTENLQGDTLNAGEEARLDGLLVAARAFHHINCIVAVVALTVAAVDLDSIHVPGINLVLPRAASAVALYLLSIALAIAADRMFRLAYPWLSRDTRRIKFAWYALGYGEISLVTVSLWLLSPVVLTAVSATIVLATFEGAALLMPGFFLASAPRVIERYLHHITTRTDHRGGPATLSVWLLYWYRIVRHLVFVLGLTFMVLAAVPSIRLLMLQLTVIAAAVWFVLLALRSLGGSTFRRIDHIGSRYGFRATNQHDYD